MNDLTKIPFHGTEIVATEIDGTPYVALRPICESIGLDYSGQLQRLRRREWACVGVIPTQLPGDTQRRDVTFIDRKTLTMWLATIDTARVKDEAAKELIIAYQREAADVLDKYYSEGGAINPRASEHQLNALIRQSQMRMELVQAAKGLIDPKHLEAKARVILAQGLGEAPEIPFKDRPLYTSDYLAEKNLSRNKLKSVSGVFGKRVKAAYVLETGREPGKYLLNLANGQTRPVNAYTEADRPLMDQVWDKYYGKVA
jgi:P22_AR N-terminal domain.